MRTGITDRGALALEGLAQPPRRRDFRFTRDARKVEAFDRWLQSSSEADILDRFGQDNEYIRRAYEGGVRAASADLRAIGAIQESSAVATAVQLPVHRDQLEALFARNFGALEGMTDATANEMRRTLSEGLAVGDGPRDIARDLSDHIDAVGRTRANTIARTEVLHSHNRARAQEYQRFGVDQVTIILAPDACPQCQALKSAAPFDVEKAPGLLPQHPNCKCAVAPARGST